MMLAASTAFEKSVRFPIHRGEVQEAGVGGLQLVVSLQTPLTV